MITSILSKENSTYRKEHEEEWGWDKAKLAVEKSIKQLPVWDHSGMRALP